MYDCIIYFNRQIPHIPTAAWRWTDTCNLSLLRKLPYFSYFTSNGSSVHLSTAPERQLPTHFHCQSHQFRLRFCLYPFCQFKFLQLSNLCLCSYLICSFVEPLFQLSHHLVMASSTWTTVHVPGSSFLYVSIYFAYKGNFVKLTSSILLCLQVFIEIFDLPFVCFWPCSTFLKWGNSMLFRLWAC